MRISNRLRDGFKHSPIRFGTLTGFLMAGAGLVFGSIAFALAFVLGLLFPMLDNTTLFQAYGLAIGFVSLPLMALAGLPWSYFVIDARLGSLLVVLGLMGSVLVNASIIGFFVGVFANIRRRSQGQ